MGSVLGLSGRERNIGWQCSWIGWWGRYDEEDMVRKIWWGRYLGLTGTRKVGGGKDCASRSLMICTAHHIYIYIYIYIHIGVDPIKKSEMDGACGTHGRQERCLQCVGWESWRKDTKCRSGHRWENYIKMAFQKWVEEAWTGLIRFRIWTGGGLMWMR